MLEIVGLAGRDDQVVRTMSGGERSRVSLATALLNEPELLVLDEPTVGLDPVLRRDFWRTFHELAASGTTLLVSSHVMDEAERCDELLLMRNGAIVATGSPHDLRERTGHEDIEEAFLGAARRRREPPHHLGDRRARAPPVARDHRTVASYGSCRRSC